MTWKGTWHYLKGESEMSYDFGGFAAQGWQCPICKRVYSPTTPMCWYCGGEKKTVVSTGTSTIKFENKKNEKDYLLGDTE